MKAVEAPPMEPGRYGGGERRMKRKLEQANLVIGLPGLSFRDEGYYALHMFAQVLGGGLTSRLWHEVRETRGLAYEIQAFHWPFSDCGLFGIGAGTAGSDVAELVDVTLEATTRAARDLDETEIARAKAQLKVSLLSALETPGGRIERNARQILAWGRVIPAAEVIAKVDAVTVEDVRRVAATMLAGADARRHRPHRGVAVPGADRGGAVGRALNRLQLDLAAKGRDPRTVDRRALGLAGPSRRLYQSRSPGRPMQTPPAGHVSPLRILALLLILVGGLASVGPARAVEAVRVGLDQPVIDLTGAIERYRSDGDLVQISTAAGKDGIKRRIVVKARDAGARPDWIAFALTNDTDEQIDRILIAPHFRLVGSGVIWPDLGGSRIAAITASQGIRPERDENPDADQFTITLDPGTTVTYVAELRNANVPQLHLWDQDAYRRKTAGLTLYKGIIIGISGLLALFLTIVFVVKGAIIFPAAAALAWSVLAYACIDFGFLQRVFPVTELAERVYRASAEAVLGATLLVFLFAYLNLARWHVRYSHVAFFWLAFLAGLVGLAVFDPPVAAGVARISIAAVAGIGLLLILYLSVHNGYDRAILLVPTWLLLMIWVTAAGFAVTGQIGSDLVQPALIGGLVLIVMLIGFTVLQHAFAGSGLSHALVSDTERRALALTGAGDVVFDWDVPADKIFVGPEIEAQLGLSRGALEGPAANWLGALHPFDVERYSAALDTVIEERRGRIVHDFRLRSSAGSYFWYRLKARPVIGADGEVIRVVGTIADVTEVKTAEERLLHDAVHDSLTGLPNRELFGDRLDAALAFAGRTRG